MFPWNSKTQQCLPFLNGKGEKTNRSIVAKVMLTLYIRYKLPLTCLVRAKFKTLKAIWTVTPNAIGLTFILPHCRVTRMVREVRKIMKRTATKIQYIRCTTYPLRVTVRLVAVSGGHWTKGEVQPGQDRQSIAVNITQR